MQTSNARPMVSAGMRLLRGRGVAQDAAAETVVDDQIRIGEV